MGMPKVTDNGYLQIQIPCPYCGRPIIFNTLQGREITVGEMSLNSAIPRYFRYNLPTQCRMCQQTLYFDDYMEWWESTPHEYVTYTRGRIEVPS